MRGSGVTSDRSGDGWCDKGCTVSDSHVTSDMIDDDLTSDEVEMVCLRQVMKWEWCDK